MKKDDIPYLKGQGPKQSRPEKPNDKAQGCGCVTAAIAFFIGINIFKEMFTTTKPGFLGIFAGPKEVEWAPVIILTAITVAVAYNIGKKMGGG